MSRQWNIREANSEEQKCALPSCGATFWTANPRQKYCCVAHGQKQAQKNTYSKKREAKRTKKICVGCGNSFFTPSLRRKYCSIDCQKRGHHLPGSSMRMVMPPEQQAQLFSTTVRAGQIPLLDDPVYEFVDSLMGWDQDEVMDWVAHQDVVYGRFAELVTAPSPFSIPLGRLEHAIESVSPKRVEEMAYWAAGYLKQQRHDRLPKPICSICESRIRLSDRFCARCGANLGN